MMVSLLATSSNWIVNKVSQVLTQMPGDCLLCGRICRRDYNLCRQCEVELPDLGSHCRHCALPLPADADLCGTCALRPPPVSQCLSVFPYQPPVDQFITGLKFLGRFDQGRVLSYLLHEAVRDYYRGQNLPELLLPVPLHKRRWRQRGFNQARELARVVASDCRIPLAHNLVRRARETAAQTSLTSRSARLRNMAAAFTITSPQALAGVRHVAIVDDVITTMATINSLAHCLRHQGIQRIDAWSLARATR